MPYSNLDVSEMFVDRQSQRSSMHARHLNEQLVRVLKTIGYDVGFQKGQGQYLYDRDGVRYLDLLSGFGVFAIGRNHPALRQALKSVLDSDLPNLVQLDVSCSNTCHIWTRYFLPIQGQNVSKLRLNSPAAPPAGPASSIVRTPITA
jgi:hypothetical protein